MCIYLLRFIFSDQVNNIVDEDEPEDPKPNDGHTSEDKVNDVDPSKIELQEYGGESKGSKLDIKALVLACVPSALAIVKDKEEQKQRETDRINLVLRFIHQDQGKILPFWKV